MRTRQMLFVSKKMDMIYCWAEHTITIYGGRPKERLIDLYQYVDTLDSSLGNESCDFKSSSLDRSFLLWKCDHIHPSLSSQPNSLQRPLHSALLPSQPGPRSLLLLSSANHCCPHSTMHFVSSILLVLATGKSLWNTTRIQ